MFNDERINLECGRIYRKGILFAVLVTLLYVVSRTISLIIEGKFHSVVTYTEAMILILGIGFLLVGSVRFGKGGDERTAFERYTFYKKAGISFIIAVFGTYILTIPFTTAEMLGGQYYNHLLILLEVLGYLYIFYAFKTSEININYSFIAEESSVYYRRVFKLIGALWLWLFLPFLIAASWELILYRSWQGALVILIAYIGSAVGLSLEYFFISLVEKCSYDGISDGRFAIGTKIAIIVSLVVEFFIAVLQYSYVYFVTGNLQEVPMVGSLGSILAIISQNIKRWEYLSIVLVGLVVCHIMSQVKKGGYIYKVGRLKVILLSIAALEATLSPVWYRALSEEAIRFVAVNVSQYLEYISFGVTLLMWILFIRSIIMELGAARALWGLPVLYGASQLTNLFLASQNMLRLGTCITLGVEFICSIAVVIVLWRYKGFPTENE